MQKRGGVRRGYLREKLPLVIVLTILIDLKGEERL